MPAVNERLADEALSHAVDLAQYSTGVVRRILATLNKVDADLFAALSAALEQMPEGALNVERLESLLFSVRALNAQAYARIGQELATELAELAAYESGYQLQLFQAVIPPQVVASVGVAAVNVEQVYAAAMARPFQGVLLREALAGLDQSRQRLIRDQVRIGFIEQETVSQIVRRLRGTREAKYADGLFQAPRRDVEHVVRTAVSHTAGFARDRFLEANADIIKAETWRATLDTRTSSPCRLRDGLNYTPVTHKPIGHTYPWGSGPGRLHWNCRSVSVPVLKSWRELGGADLPSFSQTTRSSMDGQTPASLSYADWLKRQSAKRQDEVLGPERGLLYRRGELSFEAMYDQRGRWLSISELKERDAAAFRAAGL